MLMKPESNPLQWMHAALTLLAAEAEVGAKLLKWMHAAFER